MPVDLHFPLFALADAATNKVVFAGEPPERLLLLFSSAERASGYRRMRGVDASVVRLREPKDLRMLLALQGEEGTFGVEIDRAEK